jgi:hypothetical protein
LSFIVNLAVSLACPRPVNSGVRQPMTNVSQRRPLSVWLTQILLVVLAIWFGAFAVFNLYHDLARSHFTVAAKATGLVLLLELLLVMAFWGLTKRKRFGWWLGLLCLVLLWAEVCYVQLRPQPPNSRIYTYGSPEDFAWNVITQVFVNISLLLLILRFAFAKRVRLFFRLAT